MFKNQNKKEIYNAKVKIDKKWAKIRFLLSSFFSL